MKIVSNHSKKTAPIFRPDYRPKRAIVVPCYNEEQRLDSGAFISFIDASPDTLFVFVNDGSADDTLLTLLGIQAKRPLNVVVADLDQNSGKAEAVRQGMIAAIELGAETVGYWDADLATPLDAIDDFTRILDQYSDTQVVFGSRRMLLGHRIQRNFARRFVSRMCAALARQAVRLPIGDTQCGAKMFRTSSSLNAALERPFLAGWLFDVELFSRLSSSMSGNRYAFFELTLSEWSEVPGSKINASTVIRSGWRMLVLIAELRLHMSFQAKSRPSRVPGVTIKFARVANSETKIAA